MTESQGFLKLSIKTWSRDSHGLFDYESSTTKNNVINVQGNCKLVRKKNEVRHTTENYNIEFEERELAKIKQEENKIILINPLNFNLSPSEANINELQNKIWFVIKNDENVQETQRPVNEISSDMYEININDIIKFWRVKYVVTEIKIDDDLQTLDNVEKPVFQLVSEYK